MTYWGNALLYSLLVLVTKLCPSLCDPMDCSPPGSSAHEILQARILEWVAILLSRGSSPLRNQTQGSCVAGIFFTIWPLGKPIIFLESLFHSHLNELTSYNCKTLRKQYKRNLKISGTSLAVQGLRLCALKARDAGSVLCQRTKILHAAQREKNKRNLKFFSKSASNSKS